MNRALPRSLGNPTSLRMAAMTPSMLIGIGLPTTRVSAASSAIGCREVVAGHIGLPGDRQESVEAGVAALVLAVAEARYPLAAGPASRRPGRRPRRTANCCPPAVARRRRRRWPASTDSTAAPWNSPSVSSPAAAAAWSVAPPEIAVRAANTDGAPAPWSMLATITASMSRAVGGSGSSPV